MKSERLTNACGLILMADYGYFGHKAWEDLMEEPEFLGLFVRIMKIKRNNGLRQYVLVMG